jgi:hypothetical protein
MKNCFITKYPGTVTDAYDYDNKFTYSINKYESFPEIFKHVRWDENGKIKEEKQFAVKRKEIFTEYETQKIKDAEIIRKAAITAKNSEIKHKGPIVIDDNHVSDVNVTYDTHIKNNTNI